MDTTGGTWHRVFLASVCLTPFAPSIFTMTDCPRLLPGSCGSSSSIRFAAQLVAAACASSAFEGNDSKSSCGFRFRPLSLDYDIDLQAPQTVPTWRPP
ncbi:hypothetical protein ED733_008586 [Metarhizium rileyi]|uniref:Secreted protein n=1 Tax=Metarhizium rileyi (strain RCEF 4871) TaxID=1649241 RepID=A0A5C6GK84_METRR|nr:hypothetical protein ED733_008586 [Metarhizium rileyi]